MLIEKVLRHRRDHVDDGVAHPDDIEGKIGIAQLRLQPQVNPGRLALRTPGERLLRRPHRRSRRLASLHSVTDPRLPRLAVPSAYRLELAPDLEPTRSPAPSRSMSRSSSRLRASCSTASN